MEKSDEILLLAKEIDLLKARVLELEQRLDNWLNWEVPTDNSDWVIASEGVDIQAEIAKAVEDIGVAEVVIEADPEARKRAIFSKPKRTCMWCGGRELPDDEPATQVYGSDDYVCDHHWGHG